MAKKQVWIDNTRPPTNYIWVKTDSNGNVTGVFQYNGSAWVRIAVGRNTTTVEGDGIIEAITLNGDPIQIGYSIDPVANTIAVRTETGTLKASTPSGNDLQELVTVEMISWNE